MKAAETAWLRTLSAIVALLALLSQLNAQERTPAFEVFQSAGKKIRIERFSPKTNGRHPAIILTYGAQGLTARGEAFRNNARHLANNGYVAFLIHYFDATDSATAGKLPVSRDDFQRWTRALQEGITYISKDGQVDRHRVGLLGFSLGAFLALWESSQDSRVKAVCEYYGGTSLFLGPAQRMPATLILHGEADSAVSVEEARKLERVLQEQHAPYEKKIYPHQEHGFDGPDGDPTAAQDAWKRTIAFFHRYLQ